MDELRDRNEPQEVVDWYVPQQGKEVVDYYVHHQPLPESVRPAAPQPPKKKKRLGLWIFLGIMAVVAVVVVLFAILGQPQDDGSTYDGENDDASSIVDIFADHDTTIPRVDNYDPTVKLSITGSHGPELTAQEVYAKVNPATVLVVAEQGDSASIGTGVIMTADGYVITNAHVISGGEDCWVVLASGVNYDARLVGYDSDEDLAVLKLENASELPTAEFGDSDLAVVGDTVYAIGNPLGIELRGTLTDGILSAINRDVELDGRTLTVLQTTAAPDEATVEGLGFALPISNASFVINDIIANGKFHGTPTLGIMVATYETEDGGTVVAVVEVNAGSSAEEAGVLAGDVILAVNGQTIADTADLMAVRRGCAIGDTMTLTILRDGETLDIPVVLRSNKK